MKKNPISKNGYSVCLLLEITWDVYIFQFNPDRVGEFLLKFVDAWIHFFFSFAHERLVDENFTKFISN